MWYIYYFLLVSEVPANEPPKPPKGKYYRSPSFNPDGTVRRRETFAKYPVRRHRAPSESPSPQIPPEISRPETTPQRAKGKLGASLAVTAAVGTALAVSLSLGNSSGSDTLTVQVKADLSQSIAALAKFGFDDISGASSSDPTGGTDCASAATMRVRQFLTQHQCKEYATATFTVAKSGTRTQVAITWVVMSTPSLAKGYKILADTPGKGNPPGQSEADFTGLCYASGETDETVWTEQVQPTGHPEADQEILRAMAPSKLAASYLQVHCPT
jgi:hypothetical protein